MFSPCMPGQLWLASGVLIGICSSQGYGQPFPHDFGALVRNILKRLFRVYGHIYHSHFRQIVRLELEPHLNTCFKHFILFTQVRTKPGKRPGLEWTPGLLV